MSPAEATLSIIICTYDRYDLLEKSARAVLNSRSFAPERMELVIVDNTPPIKRQPIDFGRVVTCDETGLSRARNAGLDATASEIVAFVDDDAFVSEGWCASVVRAFEEFPEAQACGGRTRPRYVTETRPVWYFDELARHLSCIDWGDDPRPLRRGEWIVGANMAFRRAAFEGGRRFDPALGRSGAASLLSNEEIALIQAIGLDRVYYIPAMEVDHLIPDERVTIAWFRRRVFWQAISDVLAGSTFKSRELALAELQDIVSRAPAEQRGHNLLSYEPATPQGFRDQLSAVYASAMLLADGFPRMPVGA